MGKEPTLNNRQGCPIQRMIEWLQHMIQILWFRVRHRLILSTDNSELWSLHEKNSQTLQPTSFTGVTWETCHYFDIESINYTKTAVFLTSKIVECLQTQCDDEIIFFIVTPIILLITFFLFMEFRLTDFLVIIHPCMNQTSMQKAYQYLQKAIHHLKFLPWWWAEICTSDPHKWLMWQIVRVNGVHQLLVYLYSCALSRSPLWSSSPKSAENAILTSTEIMLSIMCFDVVSCFVSKLAIVHRVVSLWHLSLPGQMPWVTCHWPRWL